MEVKEGYILWLKKLSDLDSTLSLYYSLDRPELYNHPVLVVRAADGSKEVDVCLLTSQTTASLHDHNLAIYPQTSSDPTVPQLRMHNDICLRKDGYVCAQKSYFVHASMLERYNTHASHTIPSYYRLTDESLAIVREKLEIRSLKEIEQQQLEQDEKMRALEADVSRLEWVEDRCETLEERVRELEAENASLRQIEAEAARLHLKDEKLRLLQYFTSWSHRVQGSRSVVRETESAESRATQPSPQMPPLKPTTEPAELEVCQDPTPNHLQRLRQWVYDWSLTAIE